MTLEELAARVTLLEAEVRQLRAQASPDPMAGLDAIRAKYLADPALLVSGAAA